MANLVIKPASGSTNKLVLQNQAGNIDAITVEDSGNTTLAGTANALGTVASGNISNAAIVYPSGHLLKNAHINIGSAYASGNVQRVGTSLNPPGVETHANFRMTCSGIPTVSSKLIEVTYNIHCSYNNHTNWYVVYSWDNSSWGKAPRGAEDSTGWGYGNAYSQYPHATGAYDGDSNTTASVNVTAIWTDTTSSNTALYVRLYWMSQNSTASIYLNRTVNNNASHGCIANSTGHINIYQT